VDKAASSIGLKAFEDLVQEQRMISNRSEIGQVLRSYFVTKNVLPTSRFHKPRGFNEEYRLFSLVGNKRLSS